MKRPEIEALTGLRGVAAFWVLLFHLHQTLQNRELWPQLARKLWNLAGAGYVGVDMFFVLSGFVLVYNYPVLSSITEYGGFLRKRLARIYPVHVTILGIAFAVSGCLYVFGLKGWYADQYDLTDLLANLTLTHAWFGTPLFTWNSVSWSISAEWFVYLAFPIVLMLTKSFKRPLALLAFVFAINLVWVVATHLIDGWMTLLRVTVSFISGVCVYRIWIADTRHSLAAVAGWICMVVTIAILVAGRALENRSIGGAIHFLPALMPILIWSLAYPHTLSKWLAKPVFKYLGYISYSFYLVHEVVILALADIADGLQIDAKVSAVLLITLAPLVSVLLAMCLYHKVEEPMRRRLAAPKLAQPALTES